MGSHARKGRCKYEAGQRYVTLITLYTKLWLRFIRVEGEVVRWSIDGSKFVVQSGSTMDVYATVCWPLFFESQIADFVV